MMKAPLFFTAVIMAFSFPATFFAQSSTSFLAAEPNKMCQKKELDLQAVKEMLYKEALSMHPGVINKVLKTLQCADKYDTEHNFILTVIDYSMPSNEKRLWVFDLNKRELLFNTYVSHGIKSGFLISNYFSNQNNSKASSIGVYKTENAYYGRYGLSLRLTGLEAAFNSNASRRAIVMHGGWYVEEAFIKKYGRAGRSWGCPAIPEKLTTPIINTIKDNGFIVAYYPNENWILTSKFLHCDNHSPLPEVRMVKVDEDPPEENRADILFAEKNDNRQHEENEAIVVMSADHYTDIFKVQAPLKRMLRKQINQKEYIALNKSEFAALLNKKTTLAGGKPNALEKILFVIPEIIRHQGRYLRTEMKILSWGKIIEVKTRADNELNEPATTDYTLHFEKNPPVNLSTTDKFIRWLGL